MLQRYREPRRWMFRGVSACTTVVVANADGQEAFARAGVRTQLLQLEVPPDRISALDGPSARERLGLSSEQQIHLHVGHATPGRNLHALQPLAARGLLLLVLSPYTELDRSALPQGPGVRVVHERVDVGDYYRAADVYVFPTVDPTATIGLPVSVLEALANGLPVVARRSPMTARWEGDPAVTLVDSDDELVQQAERAASRSRG
jgi:glycosyltransferase involved in cell wall biosynthesis